MTGCENSVVPPNLIGIMDTLPSRVTRDRCVRMHTHRHVSYRYAPVRDTVVVALLRRVDEDGGEDWATDAVHYVCVEVLRTVKVS